MTLQGIFGIVAGFLFLLLTEPILDFVALDYNNTSVLVLRILGFFIIILCFVLFFIRSIASIPIQKKVLLANMLGDFCISTLLLIATVEELLTYKDTAILEQTSPPTLSKVKEKHKNIR